MNEQMFYNYCLFLEKQKGWQRDRKFVLFKQRYSIWVSKKVRVNASPQEPTQTFLDYLYWIDREYVSKMLNVLDEYEDDIFIKTLDLKL